jgi:hypothetical protein
MEIINTVKEENVANYIDEIKNHISKYLNLKFRYAD